MTCVLAAVALLPGKGAASVGAPDARGGTSGATAAATVVAPRPPYTARVSVLGHGRQINDVRFSDSAFIGFGDAVSVSDNGRYVVFERTSSSGERRAFVRDRWRSVTRLVSVNRAGTPLPGEQAQISGNGRYVVFASYRYQICFFCFVVYRRDLLAHTTVAVSVNMRGKLDDGEHPRISTNGRYISFKSISGDLVRGDTNDEYDVFVRDMWRHRMIRVSVARSGRQAHGDSTAPTAVVNGPSGHPIVFFATTARNLTPNRRPGVVGHDLSTKRTWWVTPYWEEQDGEGLFVTSYDVSADGRFLVYTSRRNSNSVSRAYIRDRVTRHTRLVSVDNHLRPLRGYVMDLSLSSDGHAVAMDISTCTDYPQCWRTQLRDLRLHRTRLVSVRLDGRPADGFLSDVSGDARTIGFYSYSSGLVRGDTNREVDAFVRQLP